MNVPDGYDFLGYKLHSQLLGRKGRGRELAARCLYKQKVTAQLTVGLEEAEDLGASDGLNLGDAV